MFRQTRWTAIGVAACVTLAGCGGDDSAAGATTSGSGSTTGDPLPPPTVIDLVVDANRDGVVDPADPADQDFEAEWDTAHGASFLANVDDDDANGVRDVDDEVINGDTDLVDLARILVSPWPEAPDAASGVITLDDVGATNVRLWKHNPDGSWGLIAGGLGACNDPEGACQVVPVANFTTDEVRAGVELGIEGLRFRSDEAGWTGDVDVRYSIIDGQGATVTSEANPDGVDAIKLRVAPWVLWGNLSEFDTVWASDDSSKFVAGIAIATAAAGLQFNKISDWNDQWTQDYFQTAYTAMPGPGGTVIGMRVANARPWGRSNSDSQLPIRWLERSYLGPDRGIIEIYKKAHTGDSYDSHGNHDLIPPYDKGDEHYPLGRVFYGSGVLKETKAFYAAQGVQGPAFSVDTSWLLVGHIDEVFSYVPAATPRGWKLLVASPDLARTMMLQASADGFGDTDMFVGLKRYKDFSSNTQVSAQISIDEVLNDPELMDWNQEAQAEIDIIRDDFAQGVGLAADEIIEIPIIFEQTGYGMVAFSPGTVNLLAFGDYVVHPDPFGPSINGADMWKTDLDSRLGTSVNKLGAAGNGLNVYYTDDWSYYHILDGEVHCGSNPEAPPSDAAWWEVSR